MYCNEELVVIIRFYNVLCQDSLGNMAVHNRNWTAVCCWLAIHSVPEWCRDVYGNN